MNKLILSKIERENLLNHCFRKLDKDYLESETKEQKAYGLVSGTFHEEYVAVNSIIPLYKNTRTSKEEKENMDNLMNKFAIPSETPLDKRGWVADPLELMSAINRCKQEKSELIGTYHMHRVSWEHDKLRDTPTVIDEELAKNTGLIMIIISVVDRENPIIRAFYEGDIKKEIPIIFQ
ncbi:hypothetical protein [Anaerosacchariphilus polymeriproducens]|uniref:JAB domain-containing protein n=1 Tax=Anaerosacchariphilus polymeriproducens TaxID=1812858 RepID=A0A371AXU7_9FIRM|nr:hypothetical protein [Anaerosacchariphilus polymeriproducens]RDU24405.1 hypothetical protein DWV06_05380 [Anaerosacchariphilus polymeriproducens]